jgi:PEP-CTERM motif
MSGHLPIARRIAVAAALAVAGAAAQAAPINVLWFDSTPEYGGQAPDALRKEMSDYLTALNGGSLFNSTYVSSETPGGLSTTLTGSNYDVIVFDATSQSAKFNAADLAAVQSFYQAGNNNLLLDGTLYIRSISYNGNTDFPGPGGALGGLTANEVYQLGVRGGGIMIGTDHNCCQTDANQILHALVPSASFSGITYPSTDGVFNGTQMLTGAVNVAPLGIFTQWDSVPTEAITPTGAFVDFQGNAINLYSQVDVADDPGGGTRYSYISTSFLPGTGTVVITDPSAPIPEPSTYAMMALGLALTGWMSWRRKADTSA